MNEAIGIIEMFGFVTAITAADAAAKAADVKIIAIDSNKPANAESVEVPLIMAAAEAAEKVSGLINKHIIARPTDDSQKMANRTSVGRDKVGHIPNNA